MWRYNVKFQKGLEHATLSCQAVFSVPSEPNTPVLPTSVSCLSLYYMYLDQLHIVIVIRAQLSVVARAPFVIVPAMYTVQYQTKSWVWKVQNSNETLKNKMQTVVSKLS